ncbi:AraC family transcriptional regulator [Tatumella citrea]|uniref:AraC family transcriptional regulator n=1 Tax=Tatumella citrea TaxID=53336 RepID=A0A1Y0LC37_TATCI|nr:helix-turn-helix transcriptional regulator [Tatumella citrea]ARU95631.1 AraC family transcriptional regulator [Tatumella citrea]ARU99673.1 AraC family transcriptional regulator [Tatumella citrea]
MSKVKAISQQFCRREDAPWFELRSTTRSTQAYKSHYHPQLSVGAVTGGQTCCVLDGQDWVLHHGDLIVIPSGAVHSCNPLAGQPRSYHMMYLDISWCRQKRVATQSTQMPVTSQPVVRDPQLFRRYLQIVQQSSSLCASQLAARVSEFLEDLPGLGWQATERWSETSARMQQQFLADLKAPLALEALAAQFSQRKETLIRTFRRDTGMTPGNYLTLARLELAKSGLRGGDTIAGVSYQSGFADQSHFHKMFVSYMAATPGQYAALRSISDNT